MLRVVGGFSAKLDPQGRPAGNVKRLDLLINHAVVATYDNPPRVKQGTHVFEVDLTPYRNSRYLLEVVAYQGDAGAGLGATRGAVGGWQDDIPPSVSAATPPPGTPIGSATPEIAADLSDSGSGVDAARIALALDGAPLAAGFDGVRITAAPAAPLAAGVHTLRLEAPDIAGNLRVQSWDFTVRLEPAPGPGPALAITAPAEGEHVPTRTPRIALTFAPTTAPINRPSVASRLR